MTELTFVTDHVSDISPVRQLTGLQTLSCAGSGTGTGKLSDLRPLTGMSLTVLLIMNTQVSDLAPLRGMPLTHIDLWNTPVSDLAPLQGMKLSLLQCGSTHVVDLSPVEGMPLTRIIFDFHPERDIEFLRSIKTLELINSKPPAAFWSEVDAQHKGKKP